MARFRTTKVNTAKAQRVVNRAGGEAFKQSPKLELVSLLLTSFVKDSFYESSNERLDRLDSLVNEIKDKEFLAKAGIFARNEFGMRSVTHALIADVVKHVKGEEWTKNAIFLAVRRVDDMLEILGRYVSKYGKRPIPNALKKGLAGALTKFDTYQLSKYKGERSGLSLVDLINLVHPKPPKGMEKTFETLMKGELKVAETWEAKLSNAGQEVVGIKDEKEKAKKLKEFKQEAWKELVESGKIGYFALLRNLRNILVTAPELIDRAIELLLDKARIKRELVLPFRYLTAVKVIEEIGGRPSRKVVNALYDAIDIALSNVPEFSGETLVVLDDSGSMTGGWGQSLKNGLSPIEIGSLFAAALFKANDADLMVFSDRTKYVNANPRDSVMTIARNLVDNARAAGTDFHAPIKQMNRAYDRIVFLSDMQGWVGHTAPTTDFERYKKQYKCNPHVFSFDLNGYGDMQFPENNVYCIPGWSEKVFDLMKALEQDRNELINKIDSIDLSDDAVQKEKEQILQKRNKRK